MIIQSPCCDLTIKTNYKNQLCDIYKKKHSFHSTLLLYVFNFHKSSFMNYNP